MTRGLAITLACGLLGLSTMALGQADPSIASIAILKPHADSRMVSPENPTGEKAKGATRTPDPSNPDLAFSAAAANLGRGWKVRPFIKVPAHSTVTIMDVAGPATIKHIWMATSEDLHGVGRSSIMRFYWDNETTPSVEVPMSDFFAIGHETFAPVDFCHGGGYAYLCHELLLADAVPYSCAHYLYQRQRQAFATVNVSDRL